MIHPVKYHYKTDREFKPMEELEPLQDFFKKRANAEGIFLKGFDTEVKVRSKGPRSDGAYVFEMDTALEISGERFGIYSIPSDYVELEFEFVSQKENLLIGKLLDKRQTSMVRSDQRNQKVYGNVVASNFLIAKTNIDFSKLSGISSQVILTDIHKTLLKDFPQSKIHFVSTTASGDEIDLLREHKRPIYIVNTQLMDSAPLPLIYDPKQSFEEDFILEDKIAEYKRKKMDSFLMFPIFIRLQELHFFAYLRIDSERSPVPLEVYNLYKEVELTFQSRIMDSNTHTLDIKQNVLNVSRGGVAIEIRDREIINGLRVKPAMTVDINFKMQAPLRMAVELRHMEEINDYFVIGSQIVGLSGDKKAKDVYHSLITFFS